MSSLLTWLELLALLFWIAALFVFTRPSRRVVVTLYFVALGLSFLIPVYAVSSDTVRSPAGAFCVALGLCNGMMAVGWGAGTKGRAHPLPLLGITLAGFALSIVIGVSSFRLTRMF